MIGLLLTLSVFLNISLALFSIVVWKKINNIYMRIFDFENAIVNINKQNVLLSKSACRQEALSSSKYVLGSKKLSFFSQHGEEFYLWDKLGYKSAGTYVEIGAYDGVNLSNSFFFEQIGWKGVLVEAHPELVEKCRISRPKSKVVHAAIGALNDKTVLFSIVKGKGLDVLSFVSAPKSHLQRIELEGGMVEQVKVPMRTLNSIFHENDINEIDFLSIDVEGSELDVLAGLDLKMYQPRIILVEDNSGGKDLSVHKLLNKFNYILDLRVGCNSFYIKDAS